MAATTDQQNAHQNLKTDQKKEEKTNNPGQEAIKSEEVKDEKREVIVTKPGETVRRREQKEVDAVRQRIASLVEEERIKREAKLKREAEERDRTTLQPNGFNRARQLRYAASLRSRYPSSPSPPPPQRVRKGAWLKYFTRKTAIPPDPRPFSRLSPRDIYVQDVPVDRRKLPLRLRSLPPPKPDNTRKKTYNLLKSLSFDYYASMVDRQNAKEEIQREISIQTDAPLPKPITPIRKPRKFNRGQQTWGDTRRFPPNSYAKRYKVAKELNSENRTLNGLNGYSDRHNFRQSMQESNSSGAVTKRSQIPAEHPQIPNSTRSLPALSKASSRREAPNMNNINGRNQKKPPEKRPEYDAAVRQTNKESDHSTDRKTVRWKEETVVADPIVTYKPGASPSNAHQINNNEQTENKTVDKRNLIRPAPRNPLSESDLNAIFPIESTSQPERTYVRNNDVRGKSRENSDSTKPTSEGYQTMQKKHREHNNAAQNYNPVTVKNRIRSGQLENVVSQETKRLATSERLPNLYQIHQQFQEMQASPLPVI